MSQELKNCLMKSASAGLFSREVAEATGKRVDELTIQFKNQGLNETEATLKAKVQALKEVEVKAFIKRKALRQQLKLQKEHLVHLESYRNLKGQEDYAEAAQSIYINDAGFGTGIKADGTGIVPLESYIAEVRAIADAATVEISEKLKPGWFGLKTDISKTTRTELNEALGKKIDEIPNENTRLLVQTYRELMDYLVAQFNKAGGHLEKIKDIYIPQAHDAVRMLAAGPSKWVEDILPRLDLRRMIDRETGMAFTPEAARISLFDVYEKIVSGGVAREFKSTNIAGSRLDHRFLIFKEGEQVKYHSAFGPEDTDVVGLIQEYVDGMVRDIAWMKALGPNPTAHHKWLRTVVENRGKQLNRLEAEKQFNRKEISFSTEMDRTYKHLDTFDNLFKHFKGTLVEPGHGFVARSFATLRQLLTASHLGAATIPAVTDLNWQRMTNAFNGLPATNSMQRTLQMAAGNITGNDTIAKVAIRLGLGSEYWTAKLHEITRYYVEQGGFLWSKKLADGILRGTGLSGITAAGRWGFGMEFMAAMAKYSKLPLNELPENFVKQMRRYGISEDDWKIATQAKLYDAAVDDNTIEAGIMTYLRPDDMRKIPGISEEYSDRLASKFMNWIRNETNYAIPSFTAKGRIAMTGGAKGGTIGGELMLSASMFKQFPMTIIFTHVARMLQHTNKYGNWKYMLDLFVSTTVLGAMTLEAKQMLNGEKGTPSDEMKKGRYWQRAALQGGGLGLFGDFTLAEHNRYGRSFGQTMAGPVVSFISDVMGMTTDQVGKAFQGEKTDFFKSAIRFIENNSPGHSIWYAKLVWKRIIIDALKRMTDDNYHTRNQKLINDTYRRKGTTYWWKPGDRLPQF